MKCLFIRKLGSDHLRSRAPNRARSDVPVNNSRRFTTVDTCRFKDYEMIVWKCNNVKSITENDNDFIPYSGVRAYYNFYIDSICITLLESKY